jgi:hypothetical protein
MTGLVIIAFFVGFVWGLAMGFLLKSKQDVV